LRDLHADSRIEGLLSSSSASQRWPMSWFSPSDAVSGCPLLPQLYWLFAT
jgi:hypothetical protein